MSWIREIGYEESSGALREVYDRALNRFNRVPGILKVMSLRPHALKARMEFAQAVTFGGSGLGRRKEELISVSISGLLGCKY
ncbi:MAG: carboxymuconolactone decarboxylase family protein [Dehalococcoidia bacterium]|nr:carboxymuconolactone decarboxylase family protein [Dehalococcoidia bacterium]